MSTTIKSGSEYARLLEASGMAYELSPLSIAEKAFEEGADSLRAELARVKAERDGDRSDFARDLEIETQELAEALERINTALSVPAAEYVPAIREAFDIIDAALSAYKAKQPKGAL